MILHRTNASIFKCTFGAGMYVDLPTGFSDEFGAAFEEYDRAIRAERVSGGHASRHPGKRG